MMRLSSIYEMCGLQPTWFEVSFDSAAALLLMIRDWAHDVFLQTERIGSIGHLIGEFLAVEPTEAVPTPAGLRSLCCLTRASTATAGFGGSYMTMFLSVDRARAIHLRWHAFRDAQLQGQEDDWDSTSDDIFEPSAFEWPLDYVPPALAGPPLVRCASCHGVMFVGGRAACPRCNQLVHTNCLGRHYRDMHPLVRPLEGRELDMAELCAVPPRDCNPPGPQRPWPPVRRSLVAPGESAPVGLRKSRRRR